MSALRPDFDVAIVGAGFCGAMLAVHLVDKRNVRTVLFERDTFARGLAYSTDSPRHLLNLAAKRMSAFPDRPQDFVEWISGNDAEAFAERREYAAYLRAIFDQRAAGSDQLARRAVSVVSVEPEADAFRLVTDSGEAVSARSVVLAIGLFPPSGDMFEEEVRHSSRYIGDPWSLSFDELAGNVFIVGTGLTTVDVLVELEHRRFDGIVTAVSRHGLLPQAHVLYGEPINSVPDGRNALATFRSVRKAIAQYQRSGGDWRAVVDGMRPLSQTIWQGWSLREQQRFLRHIKPFWDTSRRRMPPEPYRVVRNMELRGTLQRRIGRVGAVSVLEDGRFRIAVTHAGDVRHVEADWIVNCTGPRSDVTKIDDPLVSSLLRRGSIVAHPTGLGVRATSQGHVFGADGVPNPHLFATGSLMRGVLYESISVAELGGQMKALADLLHAQLTEP